MHSLEYISYFSSSHVLRWFSFNLISSLFLFSFAVSLFSPEKLPFYFSYSFDILARTVHYINNGIILIDYIEQLRSAKVQGTLEEIVAKGCASRLRPVLMTTMTTVVGMIPSALAFGEGGAMMQPLAVVTIGGLSVSTLVTLVLIPTIYLIFDNIENSLKYRFRRIFGKIKFDNIGYKKSKNYINILSKDIEDKEKSKNDEINKNNSNLRK